MYLQTHLHTHTHLRCEFASPNGCSPCLNSISFFFFFTFINSPNTLLASSKTVKVIELKRERRYKTISEVACDSLFWNMYTTYQEYPMGSDTCLQRSPGSLHGLHQSKTQPLSRDYRQEGQHRQTNIPKRFCPWDHAHLLWSVTLCRCPGWSWVLKKFSVIVKVLNLPQFSWKMSTIEAEAA